MLPLEHESMHENMPNAVSNNGHLDEAIFASFWNDIDTVFEDRDEDIDERKEGDRETEVA